MWRTNALDLFPTISVCAAFKLVIHFTSVPKLLNDLYQVIDGGFWVWLFSSLATVVHSRWFCIDSTVDNIWYIGLGYIGQSDVWDTFLRSHYSRLRVIRIQSDLKYNSDYAKIRITQRECIRCILFSSIWPGTLFGLRDNSHYAEFSVVKNNQSEFYCSCLRWLGWWLCRWLGWWLCRWLGWWRCHWISWWFVSDVQLTYLSVGARCWCFTTSRSENNHNQKSGYVIPCKKPISGKNTISGFFYTHNQFLKWSKGSKINTFWKSSKVISKFEFIILVNIRSFLSSNVLWRCPAWRTQCGRHELTRPLKVSHLKNSVWPTRVGVVWKDRDEWDKRLI